MNDFGDAQMRSRLSELYSGERSLAFGNINGAGLTVNSTTYINNRLLGGSMDDIMSLAVVMGHEAYRDGTQSYTNDADYNKYLNTVEGVNAVYGHTKFAKSLNGIYGQDFFTGTTIGDDLAALDKGDNALLTRAVTEYSHEMDSWLMRLNQDGTITLENDNKLDLNFETFDGKKGNLKSHNPKLLERISREERIAKETFDEITKISNKILEIKQRKISGDNGGLFGTDLFSSDVKELDKLTIELKDLKSEYSKIYNGLSAMKVEYDKGNSIGRGKAFADWDALYAKSKEMYGQKLFSNWISSGKWNATKTIMEVNDGRSYVEVLGLDKVDSGIFQKYFSGDVHNSIKKALDENNGNFLKTYNDLNGNINSLTTRFKNDTINANYRDLYGAMLNAYLGSAQKAQPIENMASYHSWLTGGNFSDNTGPHAGDRIHAGGDLTKNREFDYRGVGDELYALWSGKITSVNNGEKTEISQTKYNEYNATTAGQNAVSTEVIRNADGTTTTKYYKVSDFGKHVRYEPGYTYKDRFYGLGFNVLMAHMSDVGSYDNALLKVGNKVSINQVIGYLGGTGYSEGAHLHYQLELGTQRSNPYLDDILGLKDDYLIRTESDGSRFKYYNPEKLYGKDDIDLNIFYFFKQLHSINNGN
jgi:murein DD-endopeptidase MepM/ murein hydrolase activator NlpD